MACAVAPRSHILNLAAWKSRNDFSWDSDPKAALWAHVRKNCLLFIFLNVLQLLSKAFFTFSVSTSERVTNQAHESWHLYVLHVWVGSLCPGDLRTHSNMAFFLIFFKKEGCAWESKGQQPECVCLSKTRFQCESKQQGALSWDKYRLDITRGS